MINPTPQEASFQSMRARIAELTERLAEVEKERDAWRNGAENWRKDAERCAGVAAKHIDRALAAEKERDAARAEANHLRKVGALLEARCLGAERVRDDLTDERDEARAALIQAREHYELRSELYTNDADVAAGMDDILRFALSDHQTGATQGPPNPNSGRDRLQAVLAEIRSDISDHQTGLTSDEQTAMSKALRRSGKVVGKVATEGDE